MDYRRTFRAAAVSFADLVSRLPADRWDSPGLGDWTLRELVGHTVSSALRQVPERGRKVPQSARVAHREEDLHQF